MKKTFKKFNSIQIFPYLYSITLQILIYYFDVKVIPEIIQCGETLN